MKQNNKNKSVAVLEIIEKDNQSFPHHNYLYKIETDTNDLLSTTTTSSSSNPSKNTTILTPSPSTRYILIHRDSVFKCWKGFIGILNHQKFINSSSSEEQSSSSTSYSSSSSSLLNSLSSSLNSNSSVKPSPLIGLEHSNLNQEFFHELNNFEKPIEYSGFTKTIFNKLNINSLNSSTTTTTTTVVDSGVGVDENTLRATVEQLSLEEEKETSSSLSSTIQFIEMQQDEIEFFHRNASEIYWLGFDCNHSLALNLFVLNNLNHQQSEDIYEMLIELLEESPLDFIDVSPIEFIVDESIEQVRNLIDEYLPERSFKTHRDCLELASVLNQLLYFYEELMRQQLQVQIQSGKLIQLGDLFKTSSLNKK